MELTLLVLTLIVLLALGVPVAFSLLSAAIVTFWALGIPLVAVFQRVAAGMSVFTLMAIPFFIFAGDLMYRSGIAARLVRVAEATLGRPRGGLGLVNVGASTMFGAVSGSAIASASAMGSTLAPLMKEKGYKLAHLGESKIKEKTALGIKVSYEGQPDMNLYFDKHSGLLIKTRQQFFDSDENREVVHELYYSEFKAFDPLAKEITALKKANISVKPQDLVKYVREQTPTPEIKDKIQQYIGQLGSPVFRIRIKATAELEKIGTPATPYLAKVLDSVDPEVSRRATACLANIETKGNGHLLLSAVRVISAHNPEGAVPALLNYVPWSEGVLNQEIRSALLALRKSDKANKAELLKALENKHPIVKQAAAAALGHDGGTFAKLPGRRLFPTGVQFATRCEMYRDGKLHMILQTLEVNYYNGLNDSLFAQPDLTTP